LTFALSLSCGTLTVDTTAPGVSTALANLVAPVGYVTNDATSTGTNGATSDSTASLSAFLGFRGSLSNINAVLPWISYSWKSGCINLPKFQAAIWDAQNTNNPVAWNFPGNGHYYQLIKTLDASAPSWDQSFLEITGLNSGYASSPADTATALPSTTRSYSSCNYKVFGMCGYFATVSSQAENEFIYQKSAQKGVWLGGNGRCGAALCTNRGYYWVDPVAPEYGVLFSTGRPGVATAGNYAYWNNTTTGTGNEPNGSCCATNSETALQIMGGVGFFNDLSEWQGKGRNDAIEMWNQFNVLGYKVEYGDSTAAGESRSGGGSTSGVIVWHY
jgi:hypothetical protein